MDDQDTTLVHQNDGYEYKFEEVVNFVLSPPSVHVQHQDGGNIKVSPTCRNLSVALKDITPGKQ